MYTLLSDFCPHISQTFFAPPNNVSRTPRVPAIIYRKNVLHRITVTAAKNFLRTVIIIISARILSSTEACIRINYIYQRGDIGPGEIYHRSKCVYTGGKAQPKKSHKISKTIHSQDCYGQLRFLFGIVLTCITLCRVDRPFIRGIPGRLSFSLRAEQHFGNR